MTPTSNLKELTRVRREEIAEIVQKAVAEFGKTAHLNVPPHLNDATVLFGAGGFLDSVSLLNVILDVEQEVSERCGVEIALTDDRAMSQKRSPFRTIGSFCDYLAALILERAA